MADDDLTYPVPNDPAALLGPYLKGGVEFVPGKDEAPSTAPEDILSFYTKGAAPSSKKKQMTWADTWPVKLAKEIGSALTLPGDVYQGKATVPQSGILPGGKGEPDTTNLDRVFNLAGVVGTGAIPTVGTKAPLINPELAQVAQMARDKYDIPIRGGQITSSPSMRWMDAVLQGKPFSGMATNAAEQQTGFNRALAAQMGEESSVVTRQVIKSAKKRLGQEYDDIATQTGKLVPDEQLHKGLMQVYRDAVTNIPDKADAIKNKILEVGKAVQDGMISGETFKGLIRKKGPLDPSLHSDGTLGHYVGELRGEMNRFLERNAPEDMLPRLKLANKQYSVMKTLDPIAKKSPSGDVSPALLMSKAPDYGPLYDLAQIGQIMKPMQSSGTTERLSAMQKLLSIGGAGGLEGAMIYHDPMLAAQVTLGAVGAGALKSAANAGIGKLLRSDWYTNRLINGSLGSRQPSALEKLVNSDYGYLPPTAAIPQITINPRAGYYNEKP